MKIKNQFRLFILGIILVPTVCALTILLYHYLTRPERTLINGYKQVRRLSEFPVSKRDFAVLRDMVRTLPPKVELLIVANHSSVLLTNMPELRGVKQLDNPFDFIRETGKQYFYQVVSPPLEDNATDVLLITRVPRDHRRDTRRRMHWVTRYLIIFIVAFELFCILVIVHLSNTISRSITILKDNTQRIADGDLDTPLETSAALRSTNEITHLSENLDKMRLTLKDASERRARFIMGISHDLRTPVAVIKGYTEAINDGVIDNGEELRKTLEIIGAKTNQLETMIDTLINFVRLDAGDWRNQLRRQPLAPFLREFAETSVSAGGVFKRTVTADICLDDDIEVPFDHQLFQRALENLFSNALRYTKEGDGIHIGANWEPAARDDTAESRAHDNGNGTRVPARTDAGTGSVSEADGGHVLITVSDTGTGIEEKDKAHIFDLFYRGTNSRRESGMGIGLSVVKNIIDTHGWKIGVQSQRGIGTEFTIIVPVVTQEAQRKTV